MPEMSGESFDYEIRLRGLFNRECADWFEGIDTAADGGDTILFLRGADLSAFYGLFRTLGELNCRVISVRETGNSDIQGGTE
jgi:hypothetical protein